jgi:hypothetical protein
LFSWGRVVLVWDFSSHSLVINFAKARKEGMHMCAIIALVDVMEGKMGKHSKRSKTYFAIIVLADVIEVKRCKKIN